jgi:hypothetical protein
MPSAGFEPAISNQAAPDLRLRPRSHWDRHWRILRNEKEAIFLFKNLRNGELLQNILLPPLFLFLLPLPLFLYGP